MTILNCSATTCMYNDNELCSRGEIEVSGPDARHADETNCASFRERSMDSAKNSVKEHCGCDKIQIKCEAEKCIYNEHCKCEAASIDIDGPGACACQETRCGTFSCNC